jgi:hypothetical protein
MAGAELLTAAGGSRMPRWPAESEERVVVIALLVLGVGLVAVVLRRPDLVERTFLGFTTAVAAIAGHAMGGAGKQRLARRADALEDRANTLDRGIRRAHGAAVRGDVREVERLLREVIGDADPGGEPEPDPSSGSAA